MSLRLYNTVFKFPKGTDLAQAQQQAIKIISALSLVVNPFDNMHVVVCQNGSWSWEA